MSPASCCRVMCEGVARSIDATHEREVECAEPRLNRYLSASSSLRFSPLVHTVPYTHRHVPDDDMERIKKQQHVRTTQVPSNSPC